MKTLVIGATIVDIIMQVENLPIKGGDIIANSNSIMIGGCAYNVAYILKLLDADYTLFTPIGNGFFASIIQQDFKKNNFQVVIKDNSQDNGYCIALVEPDGQRTFITYPGLENNFDKNWFSNIDIDQYSNIYFDGYRIYSPGGLTLVNQLVKMKNKTFYFCPGPLIDKIDKNLMKILMNIKPILHLNEQEILEYTNENELYQAIKKLYLENENFIFVTLGEKGVLYFDGQQIKHFEGVKVENLVDTIGAGDSHIASIIAFISQNKTIEEAIKNANIIASKVVQNKGISLLEQDFIEKMR